MNSRNRGKNDYNERDRSNYRERSRDDYDRRSSFSRSSSTRDSKGNLFHFNIIIDKRARWSNASQSVSRFSESHGKFEVDTSNMNYPTKPTAAYNNTGSAVNPNILFTLNDNTKIKKKIYIPKVSGVNFVGLLIGPKGTYQKRLEQQSGCKILIRGK